MIYMYITIIITIIIIIIYIYIITHSSFACDAPRAPEFLIACCEAATQELGGIHVQNLQPEVPLGAEAVLHNGTSYVHDMYV